MTRKSVGSFRLDRTVYTIRKGPEIILPEKETEPRLRIQMSRCPAQIPPFARQRYKGEDI